MSQKHQWSVVMPTFNRAEVLARTLDAYLAQLDPATDEIVVVDDGSSDGTPDLLAQYAGRFAPTVRVSRQPNGGPASARNRALSLSTGRWILFAGDDVIPTPGLLAAHAAVLESAECPASLGLIRWHPEQPITPLMRWLERGGVQFAFDRLKDEQLLPPEMAYSSNLAITRHRLPPPPVFDEAFRAACWEDVDLGLRLAAARVPIRFTSTALGLHWHPTDLEGAKARAERVGYYRALLHRKHGRPPERRRAWREMVKSLLAPVLRRLPLDAVRGWGYRWTLSRPDARGYQRFLREHP